MTYSLEFDARALKEWKKFGETVRQQLEIVLLVVAMGKRDREAVYRSAAGRL